MSWWRRTPPLDLTGLQNVTQSARKLAAKYQSLVSEKDAMSTPQNPAQADINADVASLTTDLSTLASVFTQIQTLVANAQAANAPVDTSALDALVSGQAASVAAQYQGLVPPAS